MVNPFDRSFFKFFIGFVGILCFSFSVLYIVGRFGNIKASTSANAGSAAAAALYNK
jgi:hypothetical protein